MCNSSTIPSLPPPNTIIISLTLTARCPCRGFGAIPAGDSTLHHLDNSESFIEDILESSNNFIASLFLDFAELIEIDDDYFIKILEINNVTKL